MIDRLEMAYVLVEPKLGEAGCRPKRRISYCEVVCDNIKV